jgi:hypothetical protein
MIDRRILVALFLLLGTGAGQAADVAVTSTGGYRQAPMSFARELPFPRSERTQAIWAEGSCWKQCQIACTANLDLCLRSNVATGAPGQAQCLATTDTCDRTCQTQCRTYGGPLLPPIPQ